MAWIESHQTLGRHPKTKRLARELDISVVAAVGHLQFLWWWALDYARDGDLSAYSAEDIADGGGWEGEADSFVKALISAGFLDHQEDVLLIHDWMVYAGRFFDKREANAQRQQRYRERQSVTVTSASRNSNVTVSNEATVPNLTKPNHDNTPQVAPKPAPEKPKLASALFTPDVPEYRLAGRLHALILQRNPRAKIPKIGSGPFQPWCKHISELMRIDGREPPEIEAVIDWCQQDVFWHKNILSTRNLREKYDRLYLGWQESLNGRVIPFENRSDWRRGKSIAQDPEYEVFDRTKHLD